LRSSQSQKALQLKRKTLTFLTPLIGEQVLIIIFENKEETRIVLAPKAAEAPPAAAAPAPAAAPVADLLGGMSATPAPAQPAQSSDNYDPFSQWEKKTPTNNNTPNVFDPMAPGKIITAYQ
jgi:hypothetical protein